MPQQSMTIELPVSFMCWLTKKADYCQKLWIKLLTWGEKLFVKKFLEKYKKEIVKTFQTDAWDFNNNDYRPEFLHTYQEGMAHFARVEFNISMSAEIIEYLNNKAGTKYQLKNKSATNLIFGLFKQQYTIEDIKKVIDKKVSQWRGTQWEIYLCPPTLFGEKFATYYGQLPPQLVAPQKDQQNVAPKYSPIAGTANAVRMARELIRQDQSL